MFSPCVRAAQSYWITVANIWAGHEGGDSVGDGVFNPEVQYGLCSYELQRFTRPQGHSFADVATWEEDRWATVYSHDADDAPTTLETHDNFAPTRAVRPPDAPALASSHLESCGAAVQRYWRLKFDQSTCPTDNIVRLYELQLLAHIPGLSCQHTVRITGAGTPRLNGVYYEDGTSNGVPRCALSAW
eukprot:SAG31_NODE_6583_length_1963_cov_1.684013_3_plen_187_part_00